MPTLESLLEETQDIIRTTEKETGKRVRLQAERSVYPSTTRLSGYLAEPASNEIIISYDPRGTSIDYSIAHEVARFLRFSRALPGERYVLVSDRNTRNKAYKQMDEDLKDLHRDVRSVVRQMFPVFL